MNPANPHPTVIAAIVIMVCIGILSAHFATYEVWEEPRLLPGPPARVDESLTAHEHFEQAYAAKLRNPEYLVFKSKSGLPKQYQSFSEEFEIKAARARIANSLIAPPGVTPTEIPMLDNPQIAIDGFFSSQEWDDALSVPIGIDGASTRLFLAADAEHLYLACDVPEETTDRGYDQFRFYFHLDITPLLVNERVHVGRTDGPLGGIRQTKVRWQGAEPTSDNERWKKYGISDWQIYRNAHGASAIDGHRRYEAVLPLDEIGLTLGVPFTAWADVETDPAKDENGRFSHRRYLGQLGAQTAPIWFVIDGGRRDYSSSY